MLTAQACIELTAALAAECHVDVVSRHLAQRCHALSKVAVDLALTAAQLNTALREGTVHIVARGAVQLTAAGTRGHAVITPVLGALAALVAELELADLYELTLDVGCHLNLAGLGALCIDLGQVSDLLFASSRLLRGLPRSDLSSPCILSLTLSLTNLLSCILLSLAQRKSLTDIRIVWHDLTSGYHDHRSIDGLVAVAELTRLTMCVLTLLTMVLAASIARGSALTAPSATDYALEFQALVAYRLLLLLTRGDLARITRY